MTGIYSLFADVLDYPRAEVFSQVRELIAQIGASNSEAAELLEKFESQLNGMSLGQLQEIYTGAFDMRPDCTTNLGCHLFGEDVRRNIFMAQLKERMESHKVDTGTELPDHLSLVLRLLDKLTSEEEIQVLIDDCLIPGVSRILSVLNQTGARSFYAEAFEALLISLQRGASAEAANSGPPQRVAP